MSKKENIPIPSRRNVSDVLAGIERATNKEEFVRKQRGLTQEPEAKRIEKRPVREIVEIKNVTPEPEDVTGGEIKGENVWDYADEWGKKKGKISKLKEIEYFKKVEFSGDMTLPVGLVDEVLQKAKRKDEEQWRGALGVNEAIGNVKKIKVIANKEDKDFTIQLWDKTSNLMEILVGCNGKIKTFSKQK